MSKKKSKLEIAQEEAMAAIKLTNDRIQILGEHSGELYKSLVNLQELFDRIRHVPSEQMIKLEKIKNIRLSWKQQADRIAEENASISKKAQDKKIRNAAMKWSLDTLHQYLNETDYRQFKMVLE